MSGRKPDAKTLKACNIPEEQTEQVLVQAIPVEFENLPNPCWDIGYRFLIPLEDDEEPYKPNRLACEMIIELNHYEGDAGFLYDIPIINDDIRYEKSEDKAYFERKEDVYKYASRDRGYTQRYNAYGWVGYVLNFERASVTLIQSNNMEDLLTALKLAGGVQAGLEENIEFYQNCVENPVELSFIGNRGTAWDWADAVVWDQPSFNIEELNFDNKENYQMLYEKVLKLESQLCISDIPESRLVHLNFFHYIESHDDCLSVQGFFDPSTFFWRPSIYSSAVFIVDMAIENIGLDEQKKAELARIYIKDKITSFMALRALRYRILGTIKNSTLNKFDKFHAALSILESIIDTYSQSS